MEGIVRIAMGIHGIIVVIVVHVVVGRIGIRRSRVRSLDHSLLKVELIKFLATFGTEEDLVGPIDELEEFVIVRVGGDIRVIALGQGAISLFDIGRGGVGMYAQEGIVILFEAVIFLWRRMWCLLVMTLGLSALRVVTRRGLLLLMLLSSRGLLLLLSLRVLSLCLSMLLLLTKWISGAVGVWL